MAAHPEKRRYSFEQYITLLQNDEEFPLASLDVSIRVADIYRRLCIPHEKRTVMPLEMIEPVDEQSEEGNGERYA